MVHLTIVWPGLKESQQAISISNVLNRFRTAHFKLILSRVILYISRDRVVFMVKWLN